MEVRKANYEDIQCIMEIINQAKQYFIDEKIFQWNKDYPNIDTIKNDIDKNVSFVILKNRHIVATFSLIVGEDICYKKIYSGKWLTNSLYATIHRVATSNNYKRQGIGNKIIEYSQNYCREKRIKSIRIDTHKLNIPMKNLIEKNNFVYCGIIKTEYNAERIAYEKIL